MFVIGMLLQELKTAVSDFPGTSGVYVMKNNDEQIIYIGKAKNLRARVRSYFAKDVPIKTAILMQRVASIDYLLTGNEYEALLLENNLIKEHHPRYNINLKDGKSYPVIRITADEYPRVFKTRRIVQDGSSYIGPFASVWRLDAYLDLIDRLYPLRKCRTPTIRPRERPCLYWHIDRCAAVCAGKTTREAYAERIQSIRALLSGQTSSLRKKLEAEMKAASADLRFEEAARVRDILSGIDAVETEQRIVDFDPEIRDYVGFASRDARTTFVVFQMRAGKLVSSNVFHGEMVGNEDENLTQFLTQFYGTTSKAPNELYASADIGDVKQLQRYFQDELGAKVKIRTPSSSRDAAVLRLCTNNAQQELEKRIREDGDLPALEELASVLGLATPPLRIEGFDIAQVGGRHTVASMVSFSQGVPDKSQYRRFRIKSLPDGQIDDFASMREAIARRYTRVKNERLPKPDLILIDGGKGQLNATAEILAALELSIPVVSIAKKHEELFVPEQSEPIRLPEGAPPLRVLQFVRDEAHRFATSYRAGLQASDALTPLVRSVEGIGPKRADRIMRAFPDMDRLVETPVDIIAKSTGISDDQARAVLELLRKHIYG